MITILVCRSESFLTPPDQRPWPLSFKLWLHAFYLFVCRIPFCNCITNSPEPLGNTQWQVYSFWLDKHIQIPVCVCVHVRQADYDYRLFIPSLFATKTHVARVRVFELVLIPCLQLISHDFIHVYSQEKLFNAFKCKQASDESTQTPPNTHRYVYVYIRTRMTTIKGRNIFPFFFIPFSFHRLRPLSDLYLLK